jgi:predicted RNA-binding protein YlxR (DUF448 family)
MIRFAISPDGVVAPDLAANLPGRGLWLSARREVLAEAVARDRFSRAARAKVRAEASLVDEVGAQLVERCLDLLGLARRAGRLVAGFEKVRGVIGGGEAAVIIAARDGAADGREKISRLAEGLPIVALFSVQELSLALGRENVVHAALTSGGLSDRFLSETVRLAGFRDPAGPEN